MSAARSYGEFSKRLHAVLAKPVPCPECGVDLPATNDDARQAHFRVCPGKPQRAAITAVLPDYTKLTNVELVTLRRHSRSRLFMAANLLGPLSVTLQTTYEQIIAAIDSELASREGVK